MSPEMCELKATPVVTLSPFFSLHGQCSWVAAFYLDDVSPDFEHNTLAQVCEAHLQAAISHWQSGLWDDASDGGNLLIRRVEQVAP